MHNFSSVMARIFLVVFLLLLCAAGNSEGNLVRNRYLVLPPKYLRENKDYKGQPVAAIFSESDGTSGKIYSLHGVGASKYPFNMFVLNSTTGLIYLNSILDRENISWYTLTGVARYNNGTRAEQDIDIYFKVLDENDNPPVFGDISPGILDEESPVGTTVMKITATDADEPGSKNSKIAYTIVEQKPPEDMFYIKRDGTIVLKSPQLDREKTDQYVLIVKGQDLDGDPEGLTGTGTVTINIRDVNDHPPTLEKEEYDGSIEENTCGVEVMRLKAEDLDQEGTPNWEAVFDIVEGNEAWYFSIKTDPETNEGVLMLERPVDYEDIKDLDLGITVRNVAPPHGESPRPSRAWVCFGGGVGGGHGGTPLKTYPVKINVKNQPEGPRFKPTVKAIPISEGGDTKVHDVIGSYPAIDGDTGKPAENVEYAKGWDPDNWLIIDPKTAEIKLNKKPDRESPYLVNGTYIARVLCISEDMPRETATGTIAIQVEDFNNHCPTLTGSIQSICTTNNVAIVNAKDEDDFPNGAPFTFQIIAEGTQGQWVVEHFNDTAAILRYHGNLWPGEYEVILVVTDMDGKSCPEPQKVKIPVCICEDGVMCGRRGYLGVQTISIQLGPRGIGVLFLALLLLLLILLLALLCRCGGALGLSGFAEMRYDTKSHFITYHNIGERIRYHRHPSEDAAGSEDGWH